MTKEEITIPLFIDTIPNVLKHPKIKKDIVQSLRKQLESQIVDMVTRYASLSPLMIQHGEYCNLLIEARNLFTWGFFYSCVAMCGITAERILKDMFAKSLLVISDNQARRLNDMAVKDLESFSARAICNFLIDAGILDKSLRPAFKALGELRNKYTHAGGKKPKQDARKAVRLLHTIVNDTVSIFKDFEIREGKLIRKQKMRS